jgi:hypothetical protein
MASLVNGHPKRGNGILQAPSGGRFAHIPAVLDLPVYGEAEEAVEISLEELPDDPSELCGLLETEQLDTKFWLTIAFAYAKKHELEVAIEVLNRGLSARAQHRADDRLTFLNALSWMYLWKAREAPRQNGRSCVPVADQEIFRLLNSQPRLSTMPLASVRVVIPCYLLVESSFSSVLTEHLERFCIP